MDPGTREGDTVGRWAWPGLAGPPLLSIGSQQILPRIEATPQQSGAWSRQGAGKPDGAALMLGAFGTAEVIDKQAGAQRGRHSLRPAHPSWGCHEGKWRRVTVEAKALHGRCYPPGASRCEGDSVRNSTQLGKETCDQAGHRMWKP